MKTAVVYASYHHSNTEKIAEAIAPVLNGTLVPILQTDTLPDVADFDLLAIGSGIYRWKFHDKITDFVENLPDGGQRHVILFSTSAFKNHKFHDAIQKRLEEKNYHVIGHFHAKGSASFLPEWLTSHRIKGGKDKGRPNQAELLAAVRFAEEVKSMMEEVK